MQQPAKPAHKKTILSGSTASGDLTLGNYIGAINNWRQLQNDYNCFYMVADLHALTVRQEPEELRKRGLSFFAQYLALGLDPAKNTIFMQSHISEHAELTWILSCITPMGNLNRMTQFKDKSKLNSQNINAGLFTYPVLMAADILLYQAHLVPVGEDQRQHLELTRDLVQYFHNRYGETFVEPDAFIGPVGARIMSLQDPTKKMSKSDENPDNYISIIDPPKKIQKKIKTAVTDSGSEVKFSEDKPGISNLITMYSVLANKSIASVEQEFEGKMYGHLKVALADLVCDTLQPVQAEYARLMDNQDYLTTILKEHGMRAKAVAYKTLASVYDKIGLIPRNF